MLDFESCFRKLYPALCVFAFRYLNDHKQSEDIVQDAFIKLWDRYSFFDHFYKIKAFLYIAVRNNAINVLNHAKVEDKNNMETGDTWDDNLESAIIDNETNRLLYQAINALPMQTKNVIMLSMEDKTNQEIANNLGISINTVKTLKKRAYKTLKGELADNYLLSAILFVLLFL